jgi:hypothetical protein
MAHARAAIASDPRHFGRAFRLHSERACEPAWAISDDAKLFASTFVAGFLFVWILIA